MMAAADWLLRRLPRRMTAIVGIAFANPFAPASMVPSDTTG
jgi:hypothetical protein